MGRFICCCANVTTTNLAKAMMINDINVINPVGELTELKDGYKKIIRNPEINNITTNNKIKFD